MPRACGRPRDPPPLRAGAGGAVLARGRHGPLGHLAASGSRRFGPAEDASVLRPGPGLAGSPRRARARGAGSGSRGRALAAGRVLRGPVPRGLTRAAPWSQSPGRRAPRDGGAAGHPRACGRRAGAPGAAGSRPGMASPGEAVPALRAPRLRQPIGNEGGKFMTLYKCVYTHAHRIFSQLRPRLVQVIEFLTGA